MTNLEHNSFTSLNSFLNLSWQNTVMLEVMPEMSSVKVSSDHQNSYEELSSSSNLKIGSNKHT